MNLAEFTRARREELGLTQDELAYKCDLSLGTLTRVEGGWERLGKKSRRKLAKGLKVSVDDLPKALGAGERKL